MTTTPLRPLFGQVLGQAQRAGADALERVLAAHGTDFDHWVALNGLALQAGPPPPPQALADLVAEGLIAVNLTPAGEERYAELRAAVSDYSTSLLGELPPEDLDTARRVLETLRTNAEATR